MQALLHDWVEQLAALFPSPWFHVGMDEPWELEKAGAAAAGGVEPGRLYIEQLKSITALVRQFGKRPMFWADVNSGARIFVKYPELFSQLPKDVIAVPWHYEVEPDYTAFVAPFAREKVPQVFAPGIWCWDEISPDFFRTFENIDGFLADARKYGAMGMVNTGWTDASQVLYRTALPAMAYGAAAAWQQEPMDRARFFTDYAAAFYSAPVAVRGGSGPGSAGQGATARGNGAGIGNDLPALGRSADAGAPGSAGAAPRIAPSNPAAGGRSAGAPGSRPDPEGRHVLASQPGRGRAHAGLRRHEIHLRAGNGRIFQDAGQPSQPRRCAVLSGMGIERAQSWPHHGLDG